MTISYVNRRMPLALFASSAVVALAAASAPAFVAPAERRRSAPFARPLSGAGDDDLPDPEDTNFYNDFEEDLGGGGAVGPRPRVSAAPDPSLLRSLRRGRRRVERSSRELLGRWTDGSPSSFAAFTINEPFHEREQVEQVEQREEELPFDWVRRIGIGAYPRVACGSAYGSVYVADVESRKLLGVARDAHSSHHREGGVDALDEELRRLLYGEYDGGGVLAVAMHGSNKVASAGREGGAKLFGLSGSGAQLKLKCIGEVPSLKPPLPGSTPVLVTCLEFDSSGRLFAGGRDGLLRIVTFAQDFFQSDGRSVDDGDGMQVAVISLQDHRDRARRPPSPILSLDISEELDMVATAHADGSVRVRSIGRLDNGEDDADDRLLGVWNPFADSSHARSVAFASDDGDDERGDRSWCVVAGGGNGELLMRGIRPSPGPAGGPAADDGPSARRPFAGGTARRIEPSHQGPVVSLAAGPGGTLVSAGHDGMLRVTRLWPEPRPLYGLGGYKVWIGDVCIDSEGKRLLSDGRDDVVVVHDFSKEGEAAEGGEWG